MRSLSRTTAIGIGVFLMAVAALGGVAVVGIANRQWRLGPTFVARADFPNIAGIVVGDRVRIQGIDAGVVEAIVPPSVPGASVGLRLRLDDRLRPLVRADATASIVPQGVVGAKVIEIRPGRPDAPPLPDGGTLAAEAPRDIADLLRDAQTGLKRVDAVASAAEKGLGEINAIAASIREGKGSLGKLVQDEEAYRALVSLSGRGNKTLVELEENLTALKHTWPLSRYFDGRTYFDREQVLFRPGSNRESRGMNLDAVFESGRSIVTGPGRTELDSIGTWLQRAMKKNSEVVIAVYSPDAQDPELALLLTQEQANAVRGYLVSRYKIDSVGWFGTRKVAAVGFGAQVPRTNEGGPPPANGRRIDVILFTPQS